MFEELRERLDALLRSASAGEHRGAGEGALREAAVEARAALMALRDARGATRLALEREQRHLADAERRGRLAEAVPDPETVRVAAGFAERHRTRVELLSRKLAVQDEEVAIAEQEAAELTAMLRRAGTGAADELEAARREVDGLTGRTQDREDAALRAELDRRRREEAVEAQLAELKRRAQRKG